MLADTLLFTALLALQAIASPVGHPDLAERAAIEKRHSNCFSYNVAGCQYGTTGRKGAVATVSSCSWIRLNML